MNTLAAFANGEANRGNELMVFDWDKAARRIVAVRPESASAGLEGDWAYTGDEIYRDGKPIKDNCCYLASTWATPELDMDGMVEPCYRMQSEVPGWGEDTKWPKSALKIIGKNIID